MSSRRLLGFDLPIAGGNYIRQFPHTLMSREVGKWIKTQNHPFVMYFHVWELDSEQPKIRSVSYLAKLRHYRNLGKLNWILEDYFDRYRFTSIAEYLQLDQAQITPQRRQPSLTRLSRLPSRVCTGRLAR